MATKIVICGPPHSGKSVFVSVLRGLLPRERFALVEGAPDGEGITGWAHEGDPALTRAVRQKGSFSSRFVEWVVQSVTRSTADITIVDVGGRRSAENERIFRAVGDYFIVISPDSEETAQWVEFGGRLGLRPLAILDSQLEGEDELFSEGFPLRARITKLEREDPPVGSLTARAVAQRILEIAGEGIPESNGSEQADVNFPALAEGLNLPLRNGGPDRDWFPGVLPGLLELVKARVAGQREVRLWGNCSAGFPYHCLAVNLTAKVFYYDPKLARYIELPELELGGEWCQPCEWRLAEGDAYSLVEFSIIGQILDVWELPLVSPPPVSAHKGVVVSGKGPWWLTGAVVQAYHRAGVRWVAVFTPQESSRLTAEGERWADVHPGEGPGVVVASRDPRVKVGTVVPFRLAL